MPRKLTKSEWEWEVKRAMAVRAGQKKQLRKAKFAYFEKYLGKLMPLPIIIGLLAVFLIVYIYGWREFFKLFLSWIVSLTLVATGAYYIWKQYEQQL